MPILVWIIGWLIAVEGIVFLVRPQVLKPILSFFRQGKRSYFLASARIVLAIVFLLAAQQCGKAWIIAILGVVLLISGIVGFAMKLETMKAMLAWWEEKPLIIIRLLSLIVLAFAALVVYAALR